MAIDTQLKRHSIIGLLPPPTGGVDTRDERGAVIGLFAAPTTVVVVPNPPQDATGPLQKTIFDALKADSVLSAAPVSGRIFDDVPDNIVFPYVRIGEFETQPWRTMTRPGEEVLVTVHVFSAERGNKEAQDIRDRVNRTLGDNIDLTVVGFTLNFILRIGGRTITEESTGGRKIRHIICTYLAKLQQDLPP